MIRPFSGIQTLGAASQPVFGTTLSAASTFAVDRYSGTNRPGTTTPAITITVASTAGFRQNDHIAVGPKANFTYANRALLDRGFIASIVDATHLTVQSLTQNHASGEYVLLDEPASHIQIVPVATTNPIYIGTDSTVAVADASVFDVISKISATVEPTYWHFSPPTGAGDNYNTILYWIQGTAGDTFVARFDQV